MCLQFGVHYTKAKTHGCLPDDVAARFRFDTASGSGLPISGVSSVFTRGEELEHGTTYLQIFEHPTEYLSESCDNSSQDYH